MYLALVLGELQFDQFDVLRRKLKNGFSFL